MKEYIAKKIVGPIGIEDARWQKAEHVKFEYTWEGFRPIPYENTAAVVHSDEGITVLLSSTEWPLRITAMEHQSRVCEDSCMEFFFTANTCELKYINFELNPAGIMHAYVGEKRGERYPTELEGVRVVTEIQPLKGWKALLFVPYSYIDRYFDKRESAFKANFYKCGDSTVKKHYCTWNPVETEKPDYHQPIYFGKITLSNEEI